MAGNPMRAVRFDFYMGGTLEELYHDDEMRRAGHGLGIQIHSFLTDQADLGTGRAPSDAIAEDLRQIIPLVTGEGEAAHGY